MSAAGLRRRDPKSPALEQLPLDSAGGWLHEAPQLELIGVLIGAWRFAAAAMRAPMAAPERLPNRNRPDREDFYRYGLDHSRASSIGAVPSPNALASPMR